MYNRVKQFKLANLTKAYPLHANYDTLNINDAQLKNNISAILPNSLTREYYKRQLLFISIY